MQLVIGNKNYSSWSMRAWILLKHFELEFEEIRVPLFVDGYREKLAQYSPTLRVPVLIDGDLTVWDSLAIVEYVNEKHLLGAALPQDEKKRAVCRSYCAEMHAGYFALRNELPMNIRASKSTEYSSEVEQEAQRIESLWTTAREHNSSMGEYLFGEFSLADCMFAPVAMRFITYGLNLNSVCQDYVSTLRANAAINRWCAEARNESEIIEIAEIGMDN